MPYNFLRHYDIDKIKSFLETRGRRVLVFDRDCDGICSAVLLSKMYRSFDLIPKRETRISEKFLAMLAEKRAGLYVFLDMAADHGWRRLKELRKAVPGCKVIIIDHHQPEKNLNSKDFIHINPVLFRDVYIPTSYLVYRIMERMGKRVKSLVWMAAMACIADYAFDDVKDIYSECRKAYPGLVGKDPKKSRLKKGVELIESIIMVKNLEGARKSYRYLMGAGSFAGLMRAKELKKYWSMAGAEIKKATAEAQKSAEYIKEKKLMLFEIKTEYRLSSPISTYFSEKYPGRTIIVRRKNNEGWSLSVRNQAGKVDVGAVVKRASRGLGSGGGHARAAGAQVRDWEKFRGRFIRLLVRG